ncbi:MAG: flagellar hook-associated protein FlgL [Candidatus Anammoxibacter sp.]
MRVSQQQLYDPLLTGARDSAAALAAVRAKISSGKEVNTISDDSLAARRIIGFQDRLNDIDQFLVNVRDADSVLTTGSALLDDVSSGLSRVRELVTQAANGILTQVDRNAIVAEVNEILNRILDDSNGKNLDDFLFSGGKTGTKPFETTVLNGEVTAVSYKGDLNVSQYQISEGINFKVNETGAKVFVASDAGSGTKTLALNGNLDTNTAIGDTIVDSVIVFDSIGNLHTFKLTYTKNTDDEYSITVSSNETGVTFSTVADAALGSVTFNSVGGAFAIHTDTVAGVTVNIAGLGSQTIIFDFSKMSQISESVKIGVDNNDGETGGYGVFDVLIKVRDTLKNKDLLSDGAQVKELGALLSSLDAVADHLFGSISTFGARANSLESTENRLQDLKIRIDTLRSSDEDADLIELISKMASLETSFQATLAVGARISSITLLNFI